MAKSKWACEKCGALYDHESQANQCESDHATLENAAVIRRFGWKWNPEQPGEFPVTVVLQFPGNRTIHGNIATYRLERIGFDGKLAEWRG